MNSLYIASIALACLIGGLAFGAALRGHLPDHHLHDDSRDVLKAASGIIATLVALVIGLMVGSSKSSFDQASAGVTQMGARVILLDRVLRRYGPEAGGIRAQLGQGIAKGVDRLWPESADAAPDLAAVERATSLEDIQELVVQLEPRDDAHRTLRSNALTLVNDLVQSRWLMIEQAQATLPTALLAVLVFWLAVLFVSLGLLAPPNATSLSSLAVCAVSMCCAIFLILEMNRPLEGVVRISPAPLHKAIAVIGS